MKDCLGRAWKMENEKLTVSVIDSKYLLFSIVCLDKSRQFFIY